MRGRLSGRGRCESCSAFPPAARSTFRRSLIAQWLSDRLGQQFIVDNRPGAGGTSARKAVIRSPPDGYTLLMANGGDAVNSSLFEKLNFVFVRDAVSDRQRQPNSPRLEVHPAFPVQIIPALIAYAKANPRKGHRATGGIGTGGPTWATELFKMMAAVDMVNVPYRGAGPMLVDRLGGQIPVAFDGISSSIGHIRSGALKALGVTSAKRLDALPDVPSIGEFVPGYEEVSWCGLVGPLNTPAAIVTRAERRGECRTRRPKTQARFAELGVVALPGSASDFQKLIGDETEKWAKVVKFAGIKPQ